MSIELTTVPSETTIDPANDVFWMNDVSETPDAINAVFLNDMLASFLKQGADIASAGTISCGQGSYFKVTGTTTITDIDMAPDFNGRLVILEFAGILTLTHNGTTLILPTGVSIVTAAGDIAAFVSEGSDAVRCVWYQRASGASLAGGSSLTGITNPVSGQLLYQPAKTDWAINIDRSDNTGATEGIRIVSGDNSNLAASKAVFILNSVEDRGVTLAYENATDGFAIVADGSYVRIATVGGVGARDIRFQPGSADRLLLPLRKDLTNNTVTSMADIALPTLTGCGGVIKGTTFVSNGTDIQSRSFLWRFSAVNKGGVYTTEIAVVNENISTSSGTLAGTWTIVTGTNKITLKFNSNSSLTPTTQWVHWTLEQFSDQAVTLL